MDLYNRFEKLICNKHTLTKNEIEMMPKLVVNCFIQHDKERNYMNIVTPKEVHDLCIEKGWYDNTTKRDIPELLCLIHSEISEALEGYRKNLKEGDKGWVGEELADAVIRIWDMSQYLGIDIAKEVNKKHEFNKTREYRHGNKKC